MEECAHDDYIYLPMRLKVGQQRYSTAYGIEVINFQVHFSSVQTRSILRVHLEYMYKPLS